MKRMMLNFYQQHHEKILLTEGGARLPFFPCLKIAQKKCQTVKASTFSDTIKTATPPSAVNTKQGHGQTPTITRSRLMNILQAIAPFGCGLVDQHPQTIQGGWNE